MSAGADPSEQLLEAARRNNTDLLETLLSEYKDKPQDAIDLINETRDSSGNGPLHLASKYGNYEVMDQLLDLDGVDVNVTAKLNGNTALHYAASFAFQDPEYALFLINELIDCGANPSIKNKDGLKAISIIGDSNDKIKEALESAEYAGSVNQNIEVLIDDDDDEEEDIDETKV